MPKLTAEQRAQLEQQLADDDDDGDDFEFSLSEGDRSVTLPWSRRESLGELGFKVPAKAPAKAPAKGVAGQDPKGTAGTGVASVFGRPQRRAST
jgi:hypothetical protein